MVNVLEKQVSVGLFGLGNVGTGIVKALDGHHDLIRKRSGFNVRLKTICVKKNKKKKKRKKKKKKKKTTNTK